MNYGYDLAAAAQYYKHMWQQCEQQQKRQQRQLQPPAKRIKVEGGFAVGSGAASAAAADGNVGEVRFEDASAAATALARMNNMPLAGSPLRLFMDQTSKDCTKIIVMGIPPSVEWQELKDHFATVGSIAFADIKGARKHGPKLTGEIRFDDPKFAARALQLFDGCEFAGGNIKVTMDPSSHDRSKLLISGLPPGTAWQELKDHFAQVGSPVAFANVNGAGGDGAVGEVRYDDPDHAKQALMTLNGSTFCGNQIFLQTAPGSSDGTKLVVQGIAPGTKWQELKDHFAVVGQVAFAAVHSVPKWAKGGGKGMPRPMLAATPMWGMIPAGLPLQVPRGMFMIGEG